MKCKECEKKQKAIKLFMDRWDEFCGEIEFFSYQIEELKELGQ